MKTKNILPIAACIVLLYSCKKEGSASNEIEQTIEISQNQAISENMTEDANEVFFDVATSESLMGARTAELNRNLSCASLTVTPLQGFPKTIVIDFGSGCVSNNGVHRKGKINIVLSDSVRKPGSTAVMTFDNYYVNYYKKEGKITWTNTSTAVTSWQRKVENGKITAPNGRWWTHHGIKHVVHAQGSGTHTVLDDEFHVTGHHTVTNSHGVTRESTVLEALIKKTICSNISKGKLKIQGPHHYATIDYGDGSCDRMATISIDGGNPITFLLPE